MAHNISLTAFHEDKKVSWGSYLSSGIYPLVNANGKFYRIFQSVLIIKKSVLSTKFIQLSYPQGIQKLLNKWQYFKDRKAKIKNNLTKLISKPRKFITTCFGIYFKIIFIPCFYLFFQIRFYFHIYLCGKLPFGNSLLVIKSMPESKTLLFEVPDAIVLRSSSSIPRELLSQREKLVDKCAPSSNTSAI